jgi:ComF family protein
VAPELVRVSLPTIRALLDGSPPDLLEPVPLSRLRMRERGFNQCELIAGALADEIGTTVSGCLIRVRHTGAQADLPRRLRLTNPVGAFAVGAEPCSGKRVVLLDDVVTTGATMSAARRTLLDAGAREVVCLAIAGSGREGCAERFERASPPESG